RRAPCGSCLLLSNRTLGPQPPVQLREILKILRHIAAEPIGPYQPFEKALDQIGALLKDSSGGSNDAFGSSVGILILGRGKDVEPSLLEIFGIRRRQRGALHFSSQQRIQMTLPGRSYPHPLHSALQVQPCFT